ETTEALELQASDRGISLTVQNPTKPLIVKGDRERLGQVLANLVENAIKYNEPGGRVEMLARPGPNQSVRISVVDDGIGIPTELIPRLTERFYRVDKSRSREQGGTGLGLAIVKHILEAHDTRLQVESKPGYGSTFMFDLKRK
ncbi:MAG: ATP-binding protein, partial [Rubricoccaceae bacterium]|nr:ATP-binding protein [Rubricoccaceae bacterium]